MPTVKHVLCLSAAALLLAGCGGASQQKSAPDSAPALPRAAEAAPGGNRAAASKANGGAPAGGTSTDGTSTGGQLNVTSPTDRSVVYTADLTVRAKNVESAAARAKQLVTAAGGYVEDETDSSAPVRANITFKVPADRYSTVLNQLAGQLGTRLSLQQSAEDVTEQVADVDSRVKSAQATIQTFRKLLNRANTVGEVLNVEQEITRREADLEALQARQKSLARRTQYATVTLQLTAPGGQRPKRDDGGFIGGLRSGWHAFVTVLSGTAHLVGWLLPFLLVATVIGVPLWRMRAARRGPATPPPPRPTPTAEPSELAESAESGSPLSTALPKS